jgi:hypothetical protein
MRYVEEYQDRKEAKEDYEEDKDDSSEEDRKEGKDGGCETKKEDHQAKETKVYYRGHREAHGAPSCQDTR